MKKRGRLFLFNSVCLEIFLLVCASFAIAFIWSESVGIADAKSVTDLTIGSRKYDNSGGWIEKTASGWKTSSGATYPSTFDSELLDRNYPNDYPPQKPAPQEYYGSQPLPRDTPPASGNQPGSAQAQQEAPKQTTGDKVAGGISTVSTVVDLGKSASSLLAPSKAAGAAAPAPATAGAGGTVLGGVTSALFSGLVWGALVYGLVKLIGGMTGEDPGVVDAMATSAGLGVAVGVIVAKVLVNEAIMASFGGVVSALAATVIGIVVAIVVAVITYLITYERTKEGQVVFICKTWNPPSGGDECRKCNNDPFKPCTEYRCRSLGAGCELLNAGTGKEACEYISHGDVNSPTITPWEQALSPSELNYTDVNIRPPSLGMKIVKKDGSCLTAFTPLVFGINTDEPAQCKIDYEMVNNFEDMEYSFGESDLYEYNHTQRMLLPNFNTTGEQSPLLQNDGTFTLYVRCRDKGGNFNVDAFAVSFCVDASPDTTPPVMFGTSIRTGSAVAYKVESSPIDLYMNELAECKWDWGDRDYNEMAYNMSCSGSPASVDANLQYTCTANLTGIRTDGTSEFYFRCKDQPWLAGTGDEGKRNANTESYRLLLASSKPLKINSIEPKENMIGSTEVVKSELKIVTSEGAKDGNAKCMFSLTNELGSFILMDKTGEAISTQPLNLNAGDYKIYVRCYDSAGNLAEDKVSFKVQIDREAPAASRVYKENGLKIVTDEDAECVYSLNSCNYNFADGLKMINSNPSIKTSHYAEMNGNAIYYIKCKDGYGNEPLPNACSIVVNSA